MFSFIRWSRVATAAIVAPTITNLETELAFRVLPTDIDGFGHLNNARYLSFMDIGRFDHVIRRSARGTLSMLLRERWIAPVGACSIKYNRPLTPGSRFVLRTRIESVDDVWLNFCQEFLQPGDTLEKPTARAEVRVAIKERGRIIKPQIALSRLGLAAPSSRQNVFRLSTETQERRRCEQIAIVQLQPRLVIRSFRFRK